MDAMFFRRMSTVDFLICAVVLPYGIVYEQRVLTINVICKGMEFIRHVLIYFSHLLLTFYSLEFTRRDSHLTAKHRLTRTTTYITIASLLLATPTLVIFEGGNPYSFEDLLDKNASLVEHIIRFPIPSSRKDVQQLPSGLGQDDRMLYFSPRFCHMALNNNRKSGSYSFIRNLQEWYMMMNGLVIFVCGFTLVTQIVSFMDSNPFVGRSSVFVRVIELNYPELTAKLRMLEVAQFERRQKRRAKREIARISGDSSSIKEESVHPDDTAYKESFASSTGSTGIFEHSVDIIRKFAASYTTTDSLEGSPVDLQQGIFLGGRTPKTSSAGSGSYTLEVKNDGKARPSMANTSSTESSASGVYVSLGYFLCTCQMFSSQGKRIRKLGSYSRTKHTYKFSIWCLIILDLLVMCCVVVGYIISDEMSYVVNLVHVKSVFGFLVVSLIHEDLYFVTWQGSSSSCRGGESKIAPPLEPINLSSDKREGPEI
ncbi:hypothetical protein BsWGS_23606 [Bradybaena similaris]